MGKMIAYCGLMCDECNAYKATANNEDALRRQTSEEWSKLYGVNVKAEDVNYSNGKLLGLVAWPVIYNY